MTPKGNRDDHRHHAEPRPHRPGLDRGRRRDDTTTPARLWAVAGLGAALAGAGTIVTSSAAGFVYGTVQPRLGEGVADALSDKAGVLFAFHSITALGACS